MKTPALLFLLVLALVMARAQTPPAPAPPDAKKVDPFDKTRANIELLLGRRLQPPAFDPTRHSPFLIGPAGGVVADPKTPEDPPPAASSEMLLRILAPRLRVTGFFAREGLSYATVDGTPRKEGDFIIMQYQGTPVNIRVKLVENGRLVLGLGEAEYVLRLAN